MGMVTGEGSIPGDFSTVTDLHIGACLEDGAPEDRAQSHEPAGGKGWKWREGWQKGGLAGPGKSSQFDLVSTLLAWPKLAVNQK